MRLFLCLFFTILSIDSASDIQPSLFFLLHDQTRASVEISRMFYSNFFLHNPPISRLNRGRIINFYRFRFSGGTTLV